VQVTCWGELLRLLPKPNALVAVHWSCRTCT